MKASLVEFRMGSMLDVDQPRMECNWEKRRVRGMVRIESTAVVRALVYCELQSDETGLMRDVAW